MTCTSQSRQSHAPSSLMTFIANMRWNHQSSDYHMNTGEWLAKPMHFERGTKSFMSFCFRASPSCWDSGGFQSLGENIAHSDVVYWYQCRNICLSLTSQCNGSQSRRKHGYGNMKGISSEISLIKSEKQNQDFYFTASGLSWQNPTRQAKGLAESFRSSPCWLVFIQCNWNTGFYLCSRSQTKYIMMALTWDSVSVSVASSC